MASALLIAIRVYVSIYFDYPLEASCSKKNGRIAIWDKEKIVFVITMCLLVTDISFIIDGGYLVQIIGVSLVNQVISQVPHG